MSLSMKVCNLSLIAASVWLITSPIALTAAEPETTNKPQSQPAATPKPAMTAAECVVWNRERSFAASVEHHDAAAFAEHVHAKAVFDASSPEPTRGRDAIVASWKGLIDGKSIKLNWSPGTVAIGGDGGLAVSSGPDWIEDLRPNPKQHYQIGEFSSIWIKDVDGQWRVLFDAGNVPPHAASADDVAKLVASLPKECPQR
jgi:ketosteroid isomerase-like protein